MKSLPSLLRAIVDVDGEALVIHSGEKPYVVAPAGHVDLATRPLTPDAVKTIVARLLPADASHALDNFGSVQHEIVSPPEFPGESFTVVAARAGDDMWVEIRRRKVGEGDFVPEESFAPAARRLAIAATVRLGAEAANLRRHEAERPADGEPSIAAVAPPMPPAFAAQAPVPASASTSTAARAPKTREPPSEPAPPPPPAVKLTAAFAAMSASALDRLLRIAAARGASTLYLSSHAQPSVRVDGELQTLDDEPALRPDDIESLLLTVMPQAHHEALRSGLAAEWISELEGVGRVRCISVRDQRGPGGVFRLMPVRAVSTDQLGLSREVESLALEPGGLVLIAGPRLSGKRTMISALVDFMNRTRRDHVITIESEINVTHGPGTAIISQREVRGRDADVEDAARAALREEPDVLVIESLRSAPLIDVALEAATSGRLVIGGLSAHDTGSALDRIVNRYPAEERRQVQLSLAENLRGIVAQVLLRKAGGGRVAAREVLLNTPAVASVIADGRTSQLAKVIDSGRGLGMQRLNDALVRLVQTGAVDLHEAYRWSADRTDFVAQLKRLGMDTAAL